MAEVVRHGGPSRALDAEELRIWAAVARHVTLAPGRKVIQPEPAVGPNPREAEPPRLTAVASSAPHRRSAPGAIEPNRLRRVARGRDDLDVRVDLHGLTQTGARGALLAALHRTQDAGGRWMLVITGKGIGGDGVLRRRLPEWLAESDFRPLVSGWSFAGRRHGGDGAVYLAVRRPPHGHLPPLSR